MKITTQEEQLAQLRASSEAERRLLEDTIRALRENLEVATADTAQNLESLRAAHDGNQREAERNIQAVRDTTVSYTHLTLPTILRV